MKVAQLKSNKSGLAGAKSQTLLDKIVLSEIIKLTWGGGPSSMIACIFLGSLAQCFVFSRLG